MKREWTHQLIEEIMPVAMWITWIVIEFIMVQLEIDNSCKEEKKEEINEEYTKGAKKVKKNKVIIIFLL